MQMLKLQNVIPRTLADDLLIVATGENSLTHIINATESTHEYLADLGSRVATNKSMLFASTEPARKILKQHMATSERKNQSFS